MMEISGFDLVIMEVTVVKTFTGGQYVWGLVEDCGQNL
jgi:hypothetical protein